MNALSSSPSWLTGTKLCLRRCDRAGQKQKFPALATEFGASVSGGAICH
jgi:hypothetical protein